MKLHEFVNSSLPSYLLLDYQQEIIDYIDDNRTNVLHMSRIMGKSFITYVYALSQLSKSKTNKYNVIFASQKSDTMFRAVSDLHLHWSKVSSPIPDAVSISPDRISFSDGSLFCFIPATSQSFRQLRGSVGLWNLVVIDNADFLSDMSLGGILNEIDVLSYNKLVLTGTSIKKPSVLGRMCQFKETNYMFYNFRDISQSSRNPFATRLNKQFNELREQRMPQDFTDEIDIQPVIIKERKIIRRSYSKNEVDIFKSFANKKPMSLSGYTEGVENV